jgi:hypothetical protein
MHAALIHAHRANLRRYCALLATELTELEREYLHRRIAETRHELDRLKMGTIERPQTSVAETLAFNAAHVSGGARSSNVIDRSQLEFRSAT